ncbi:MAG: ACT domain-containing protein, partial [Nitrospirae bacterium]|nr:ACT domain-containing protein [Nitrospirota bacterium]
EIARDLRGGSIGRVPVAAFGAEARRALPVRKMEAITSRYSLRFTAQDKPGVLSKISGILGAHQISIESVIQKGRGYGEAVPVVMMSHESQEQNVRLALEEIDRSPVVTEPTVLLRVEA